MKPYIICYDLNIPNQRYEDLYKAIESLGAYCKLQKSVWIIKTSKEPVQIYEILAKAIDKNDDIFIAELTDNYYGWSHKDNWEFLSNHIF
ncbi:CRISPR-associated endonuclease Cas2 [Streptococcus sp. P25B114]|uniref:CRISPR associated protein Cas2 n=1 Tax=Streptococcus suis TaxID=1307 RepID=A0A0Z8QA17_STRSU|nr:CRISPR-associated endonuclease Cas2 [Streptococcus suis]MCQ8262430.1 CRISPR-associated endonuclease Cas2 [Streptococcus suis]MDW8766469.1 CRISPR-associated endonuclease Cas2 [Streptococcus suis]MDW8777374.1 CRISPR-associated endonuclease Cas2 [Streptococcus suis]NJW39683.1 CRISPR-associated endonuclease Cas2 [Streptococcus suis]NQG30231.1 CRISPR-associated endonuclease Cas2 [Streptococcus suis]